VGSFQNLFLQSHRANFNQTWHKSSSVGSRGFKVIETKGIALLQGEIITKE
jgi:hypothetical protein